MRENINLKYILMCLYNSDKTSTIEERLLYKYKITATKQLQQKRG